MGTKGKSPGSQHNPKGVTQGNTLIDPNTGNPVSVIPDTEGNRRLAVDAKITAQVGDVNVELDFNNDSVQIGDPNTGATLRVEPDGSINTNTEIDAADGDNISVSAHPQQVFQEYSDIITTASFEEIFSYTSADNRTRLLNIVSTVSTPSLIQVKINGTIVRQLWTSPLERNAVFKFDEHRPLLSGQTITVEAKVERLIHSTYETFTSLEGYLN